MMIKYLLLFAIGFSTIISCTKLRESAGVTRKSLDEFQIVKNPPLVIPPDFNLLPPEQLEKKNIDDVEKDLAEEILFGLDENKEKENDNELSTMNQILETADAKSIDPNIRNEIDQQFAEEIKADGIFKRKWENEYEILDAIEESERIRNQLSSNKSIADGEVATKTKKVKIKKKKRFFFF